MCMLSIPGLDHIPSTTFGKGFSISVLFWDDWHRFYCSPSVEVVVDTFLLFQEHTELGRWLPFLRGSRRIGRWFRSDWIWSRDLLHQFSTSFAFSGISHSEDIC